MATKDALRAALPRLTESAAAVPAPAKEGDAPVPAPLGVSLASVFESIAADTRSSVGLDSLSGADFQRSLQTHKDDADVQDLIYEFLIKVNLDVDGQPLSKNGQKRMLKQIETVRKRREKAAATTAATATAAPAAAAAATEEKEEVVDEGEYLENRKRWVSKCMADKSFNPYPHKFVVSVSIPEYVRTYADALKPGDRLADVSVSIAGRVYVKRSSGTKLVFYDLHGEGAKVQILADLSIYHSAEEFEKINDLLHRGDIVGVVGHPCKSKRGELSILPTHLVLLSPCLHMLPSEHYGVRDPEVRFRQRYLDMIMNEKQARDIFYKKSAVIKHIRKYLDDLNFLEVETPMMNIMPGGAAARPFKTFHNDLGIDMYMRIAPELYLKQLVIGGFDRVYEIGRQFRNEGIDLTHNPEFTTLEFYMAYADYHDLIRIAEDMVSSMVLKICGTSKIKYQMHNGPEVEIDFTPPFRKIRMIPDLEAALQEKIPTPFESPECEAFLKKMLAKHKVNCTPPMTITRMLDKLVGHFLEVDCLQPTFIMDHPVIMSPLAKYHRDNAELTERFELFVCYKEICNAYTELNNPLTQRERFAEQAKDRAAGDDEGMFFDEGFCTSLEYGLPPTGGFGLGIERLTMMLSNMNNIKEVLLFPAMRPDTMK